MKSNKNIFIIICFILLLSAVFYLALNDKVSTVELPSQQSIPAPDKTPTQSNLDTNNLKISSDCFNQANLLLKEYRNEQPDFNINMNNHVNTKLQKCIVEFTFRDTVTNVIGSEVRDAYENRVLVGCLSGGPVGEKFCDIPAISSPNGEYQKLTKDVGEKMISDYMNN